MAGGRVPTGAVAPPRWERRGGANAAPQGEAAAQPRSAGERRSAGQVGPAAGSEGPQTPTAGGGGVSRSPIEGGGCGGCGPLTAVRLGAGERSERGEPHSLSDQHPKRGNCHESSVRPLCVFPWRNGERRSCGVSASMLSAGTNAADGAVPRQQGERGR